MADTFHIDAETKAQIDAAHRAERAERDAELERQVEAERAEIPSNADIIAMIPSRAVREHLRTIGHEFSERDRLLLRRYLAPKSSGEFETLFEMGRYVSVPHPFRRGDIVCDFDSAGVGEPETHFGADGNPSRSYTLGIMRSFDDDADWQSWDAHMRRLDFTDFSDVSTTVEFLRDDGSFSHEHPNPMQLEFARDVPGALAEGSIRTDYLTVASELMSGSGSIELYEMYKKSYAASAEHLLELMEKLRHTLHEYGWRGFDRFRSLYIPDDLSPVQKLTAAQKAEAESILHGMECDSRTIERAVRDLALPITALTDSTKRGTFGEDITAEQKRDLLHAIENAYLLHTHVQWRIAHFSKYPGCPRHQFWQSRVKSAMARLDRLLSRHLSEMQEIRESLAADSADGGNSDIIERTIDTISRGGTR